MDQYNLSAMCASAEEYIGKPLDTKFNRLSDLVIETAGALGSDDPVTKARLHVLRASRGLETPEGCFSTDPAYLRERREVERYAETFCDDVHLILVLDLLLRLEELNEST